MRFLLIGIKLVTSKNFQMRSYAGKLKASQKPHKSIAEFQVFFDGTGRGAGNPAHLHGQKQHRN